MTEPLHERIDRYRGIVYDLREGHTPPDAVQSTLNTLHAGLTVAALNAITIKDEFPRPFRVVRTADPEIPFSTKLVAMGMQFPDGTTVIRWEGHRASTTVWDSLADALAVLGNEESTRLVWPNI